MVVQNARGFNELKAITEQFVYPRLQHCNAFNHLHNKIIQNKYL